MQPKGKVLFVSFLPGHENREGIVYAPLTVSYSIYKTVCNFYGEENVLKASTKFHTYSSYIRENILQRIIRKFFSQEIQGAISLYFQEGNKNNIAVIFFEDIFLANEFKKVKKRYPNVKIVYLFHNYELCLSVLMQKHTKGSYMSKIHIRKLLSTFLNERRAVKVSDGLIFLTDKDRKNVLTIYHRRKGSKAFTLPVCMYNDNFSIQRYQVDDKCDNKKTNILFVGSDWLPNIQGLALFIKEALPKLHNVTLHVAGKICLEKSKFSCDDSVVYHGYVDRVEDLYYDSHFVVCPIFWGGGMKVKVAEALMYGKTIFGTPHAFTGYEINSNIGEPCKTTQDFVLKIRKWIKEKKIQKFNPHSRRLYEQSHSASSHLSKMEKVLTDLNLLSKNH